MKPRVTNPPVDLDVTRERLTKLGLTHAAEQLAQSAPKLARAIVKAAEAHEHVIVTSNTGKLSPRGVACQAAGMVRAHARRGQASPTSSPSVSSAVRAVGESG